MLASTVITAGILVTATPGILRAMDGRQKTDLDRLLFLRFLARSGIGLIGIGLTLFVVP